MDTDKTEPHPVDFYKDFFVNRGTGGLNDYWIAASLGAINLDGSQVFGWKTLHIKRDDYVAAHTGRWDKINGALAAFPEVDTTKFAGVVAIFNTDVGDSGTQGGVLAGPGDVNCTFLGHETGHVFGLEHSFDESTRKDADWSAPGEYFDEYDIMSAMNCDGDSGHRFSPRGPLLNVANVDRMGWLPAARVWRLGQTNSSGGDTIDIVALEHPEIPGYLAAQMGGVYVEFRMPDSWDTGIGHPAVLLHVMNDPNSHILPSDADNFVNEWQPGQAYGRSLLQLAVTGGMRIEVLSYNLPARTARIRLRFVATRVHVVGPGRVFGGVAAGGDGIVILPNGQILRIPPRSPLVILPEGTTILQSQVEGLQSVAVASHVAVGQRASR